MSSPFSIRVHVDGQGRMVLPRRLRDEVIGRVPGDVMLRRTAEGILLSAADQAGEVHERPDGLPILTVGRKVTNEEVLAAIDADRADR